MRKAIQRDHLRAFDRLFTVEDGEPHFNSEPPVLVPIGDLLEDEQRERYVEVVQEFLTKYRTSLSPTGGCCSSRIAMSSMARKVVGVGSVGTRAWVVLMMGRDANDPLVLQLKEAQPSVLAPYAGDTVYESQGRRVVEGQRLIQVASDHMLGWYNLKAWDGQERDFYVRQLWDGKASIDITRLTPKGLAAYGDSCGWTLAGAHARSGDRSALAAYLGEDTAFEQAAAGSPTPTPMPTTLIISASRRQSTLGGLSRGSRPWSGRSASAIPCRSGGRCRRCRCRRRSSRRRAGDRRRRHS